MTAAGAGAGAADFDASTVPCEAALKPAFESEGRLEAGPGTVDVAGGRIVPGARTGRAWLRSASKRTAATRKTQRGTASVFLVLTMGSNLPLRVPGESRPELAGR